MSTNKAIHENQTTARYAAMDLNSIADAADVMGNSRLSEQLREIAETILISANSVAAAYSTELSAHLNERQKAIGDTLMALLDRASPEPV